MLLHPERIAVYALADETSEDPSAGVILHTGYTGTRMGDGGTSWVFDFGDLTPLPSIVVPLARHLRRPAVVSAL